MVEDGNVLDDLLCKQVWGENYKANSEYLIYQRQAKEGRAIASIHLDLKHRLAFREEKRKLYEYSGW